MSGAGGESRFQQTLNFQVGGRIDNRSRMQIAQATGTSAAEALRRNGKRP
jgi:hypothetical protein